MHEEWRPPRSRRVEQARVARRAQKQDRYGQVVELHQQRVKAADIASRVGIGERTVHRWKSFGSFPETRWRRRRPGLFDPYECSVLQWWQDGNRNGSRLYRELTSRGDIGSSNAMYNYLATLRASQSRSSRCMHPTHPLKDLVIQQSVRLPRCRRPLSRVPAFSHPKTWARRYQSSLLPTEDVRASLSLPAIRRMVCWNCPHRGGKSLRQTITTVLVMASQPVSPCLDYDVSNAGFSRQHRPQDLSPFRWTGSQIRSVVSGLPTPRSAAS